MLKRKGESKQAEQVVNDTIGYYIEFSPGDKEPCVYFGMSGCNMVNRWIGILESNHFYPKIGGHVFTPKFGKKNAGTRSF